MPPEVNMTVVRIRRLTQTDFALPLVCNKKAEVQGPAGQQKDIAGILGLKGEWRRQGRKELGNWSCALALLLPAVARPSGRGVLMSAGKHTGFCGRIPGMFYISGQNFCGCLDFGCFATCLQGEKPAL